MSNAEERALRFQAVRQIMDQAALDTIVAVGNGCVGINSYGCFRYLTDIRVFYDIACQTDSGDNRRTRVSARDFVAKYTQGDKLCSLAVGNCPPGFVTHAYREEVYRASRIRYAQEDQGTV